MLFDDNRLLFFDRQHIESTENVTLTLNPPPKCGPCLHIEKEWELGGVRPLSIISWEGAYRFYYKVTLDEDHICLAMASSTDGVGWERPELGVVPFNGSTANNLVDIGDNKPNEVCVFVDPVASDEHRFKAVGHSQQEGGMYLMTSPDGLRFKRHDGHLLQFIVDCHNSSFYDPRIGKYVIYFRGWSRTRPIPPIPGSRVVLRAETDDLFHPIPYDENAADPWPVSPKWSDIVDGGLRRMNREVPTVLSCDEEDPPQASFYQPAAVQYLPDTYFAFPSLYYSFPWPPEGKFINDGVLDLQFAASRDGISWRRDFRGSYVRLDLPDGACTKMMHMLTGMAPTAYRISQYYVGGGRTHGEGRVDKDTKVHRPTRMGAAIVHRIEQRMDGFVSADSSYTGGTLLTMPFVLGSDELRINVDTSASGTARAALLDEGGSAIPGYGLEDSDCIQGNDTQYVLAWRGESGLSDLVSKPIRLLLQSRNTKVFAVYPGDGGRAR